MIPRGRLAIGWRDLALAAGDALRRAPQPLLGIWPGHPHAFACRSLRSALDLLLRAWRLPPGEALVSAVNLPGMFAVLRAHGLEPVPVHPRVGDLALDAADLAAAATPRTRLVLVAHLFGARTALDPVLAWADARGLPVIEDCAQAYAGPAWSGHPRSAAALFSFGAIKTATALGGGVAHVRDPALRARCLALLARDPTAPPRSRLARVAFAAALRVLTMPAIYGLLARGLAARGRDLDDWLRERLRGYPDDDIARLRVQPCAGLLRTLRRRLHRFDSREIAMRMRAVAGTRAVLPPRVQTVASTALARTWWCLPVEVADPAAVVTALRARGIDATRRGSALVALGGDVGAGKLDAGTLARLVYLPVRGLGPVARAALAAVIR